MPHHTVLIRLHDPLHQLSPWADCTQPIILVDDAPCADSLTLPLALSSLPPTCPTAKAWYGLLSAGATTGQLLGSAVSLAITHVFAIWLPSQGPPTVLLCLSAVLHLLTAHCMACMAAAADAVKGLPAGSGAAHNVWLRAEQHAVLTGRQHDSSVQKLGTAATPVSGVPVDKDSVAAARDLGGVGQTHVVATHRSVPLPSQEVVHHAAHVRHRDVHGMGHAHAVPLDGPGDGVQGHGASDALCAGRGADGRPMLGRCVGSTSPWLLQRHSSNETGPAARIGAENTIKHKEGKEYSFGDGTARQVSAGVLRRDKAGGVITSQLRGMWASVQCVTGSPYLLTVCSYMALTSMVSSMVSWQTAEVTMVLTLLCSLSLCC